MFDHRVITADYYALWILRSPKTMMSTPEHGPVAYEAVAITSAPNVRNQKTWDRLARCKVLTCVQIEADDDIDSALGNDDA